ncbi:coronatine-insensitive protein 1-like protein [Tanacetum coccineum]
MTRKLFKRGGYVTPWVKEIVENLKWLECVWFRRMIVSDKDLEVLAERCGVKVEVFAGLRFAYICYIPQRQIRGIPGDLSLGIPFPGDMSPGISGTE